MLCNRKFICSLILGLFSIPTSSLELQYRQDADLLFRTFYRMPYEITYLFEEEAQKDVLFSPLLNICQTVGISKCYDNIIEYLDKINCIPISSLRVSTSIEHFLESNDIPTENEKTSLKNLSYLSYIYTTMKFNGYKSIPKNQIEKRNKVRNYEKNKIPKQKYIKHQRNLKYSTNQFV